MGDFPESGKHSAETLEQELHSRTEALRIALHNHQHEQAREIALELTWHSRPDEFRLEGLFALGRFAGEDGQVEEALNLLEEARQLAIDTESYGRAAEIQRSMGLVHRHNDDRDKAAKAFAVRRLYEKAAEQFPTRRFRRFVLHDD